MFTQKTIVLPELESGLHALNRNNIWAGFKQLVPISFFVVVFGLAFGLSATQVGLDNTSIIVMSTLVFAGASQFATLELWGSQVAIVPLAITVFAINARHLLMGATLYPWLRHLPPAKRYGVMVFVSDANWAMSLQSFLKGEPAMGLLFGGGLALWTFWVLGTWLGLYFGSAIHDPMSLGLDMVMACFLLAMVVGGDKNVRIVTIWAVAGASSLLAYWYLPPNSHVVVGALAGGTLGAVWVDKKP
ncbi:MAG: AzlC family ABC transporter permease [Pontibacterium sp.]